MADARNRTPKKTKNENMHGFRRIVGVLVVFPWSVFHPPPPLAKISWCAKKNILPVSARGGGGFFQKVNAWWNGTGLEWNPPKYQLFLAKRNDFWLGCSISCDGHCLLGVRFFDLFSIAASLCVLRLGRHQKKILIFLLLLVPCRYIILLVFVGWPTCSWFAAGTVCDITDLDIDSTWGTAFISYRFVDFVVFLAWCSWSSQPCLQQILFWKLDSFWDCPRGM